jgi:hypothetical protein
LVESDELEVMEEDVFAAVMSWVKEDEAGRKEELGRLLPLVRFPMMEKAPLLMMAEPLVAQHPLAFQLVSETHQVFAEAAEAATCPRRQPRKGQQLGSAPAGSPAFTRASPTHYDFSGEDGTLLRAVGNACNRAAVCTGHVMRTGRHAVEFTVVQEASANIFLGLARPAIDVDNPDSEDCDNFWGIYSNNGAGTHDGYYDHDWAEGLLAFGAGDVVGLLLDCDAGTLTVKRNGVRLGVAATGLAGEWCWAASLYFKDRRDRIGGADAAAAGW